MSYLGTLLELPHGSRTSFIGLHPFAKESTTRHGTVYLHIVALPDGSDLAAAGGATSTFLPTALVTIQGNQPDGSTWFALFQLAEGEHDIDALEGVADAAILRALSLTGLDESDVWSLTITADDLRAEYAELGDVTSWSVSDLLTGLIIELVTEDLAAAFAGGDDPTTGLETAAELRRERLQSLLVAWAETYEGPAA